MTHDVEVSRRQEVIMGPGRQFQLTGHEANYLELALHSGSNRATFDTQLDDAFRQMGTDLLVCPRSGLAPL